MGNFQHLAQKVLSKHDSVPKVSCFTPLEEETGNFQAKSGNNVGNFEYGSFKEIHCVSGLNEETIKDTSRKPESRNQETFTVKINNKSFLIKNDAGSMLDSFFSNAARVNIDLLPDDKRWLKAVCFGCDSSTLAGLLSEYIDRWYNATEQEPIAYKKQNVGRKAANIWLRETLTIGIHKERLE